jgi:hypothetical protein
MNAKKLTEHLMVEHGLDIGKLPPPVTADELEQLHDGQKHHTHGHNGNRWVLIVEFDHALMNGIGIEQMTDVPWPNFEPLAEWIGASGISSVQFSKVEVTEGDRHA